MSLSGEPKVYVKVGESGNRREQTFCANCGTPIYSAPPGNLADVVPVVGTTRQRDQLPQPTSIGSARRRDGSRTCRR